MVIEEDPDLAEKAQNMGMPVLVGDATNTHLLEQAHVERARVVVVAISDAARHPEDRGLRAFAHLHGAHHRAHPLCAGAGSQSWTLGANEVIPEEFETSIEIFHRVLRKYLVPEDRIQDLIASCRRDHYGMLRGVPANKLKSRTLGRTGGHRHGDRHHHRDPGRRARWWATPSQEAALREQFGITVLAIRRDGRYITTGDAASVRILTDDTLYLLGSPEHIVKLDHACDNDKRGVRAPLLLASANAGSFQGCGRPAAHQV